MYEHSLTGQTIDVLQRGLKATTLRHATIMDNIANADTPGFKRTSVSFEEELRRALAKPEPREINAVQTDRRHYSFDDPAPALDTVQGRMKVEFDTFTRNDKSNYYLEEEMVNLYKNSERYMVMAQLIGDKFKGLSNVVQKGGSR